ncbi:MAG: hypothetical protein B7Z02_14175 [Rhodobacterales bacterium 32-67-9]|nr:MAG: hypothetical protein B7Z02_14175 [Rhodobacterales bacterium 32-67-9]
MPGKKTTAPRPKTADHTAPKTAARAASKPKAAPKAPQPAPAPAARADAARTAETTLKKKELFARVAAATGAKQGEVKLITEAVLDILGQALSAGAFLALPPFGKARVSRQKALATGELLVVRLRRGGGGTRSGQGGNEALEEAAE